MAAVRNRWPRKSSCIRGTVRLNQNLVWQERFNQLLWQHVPSQAYTNLSPQLLLLLPPTQCCGGDWVHEASQVPAEATTLTRLAVDLHFSKVQTSSKAAQLPQHIPDTQQGAQPRKLTPHVAEKDSPETFSRHMTYPHPTAGRRCPLQASQPQLDLSRARVTCTIR